jgi:hypothetical protein
LEIFFAFSKILITEIILGMEKIFGRPSINVDVLIE